MARRSARAWPDREHVLVPERTSCPACDGFMRVRYENRRRLETLSGSVRLRLKVRRCEREDCARRHKPYRPEAEGAIALPQHEFGLDVIALVGALRHREHRSIPEIHAVLRGREVEVCERSVTNLLDRYDELLAVSLTDSGRLRGLLAGQGRVILAIDGIRIAISATAGASGASGYGSPPARRACPHESPSMGSTSTTKARCGCGPTRAPTANTRPRCCAGSVP